MSYTVKSHLLGFEQTERVELETIDEGIIQMTDVDNPGISFTLINPYRLREYSFDVPVSIQVLLEISARSNINVYNIMVVQKPYEKSVINFLAPIVINEDTKTLAQVVLNQKEYPEFGVAEEVSAYLEAA